MLVDEIVQVVQLVVDAPQAFCIVILATTLKIFPATVGAIIAKRRIFVQDRSIFLLWAHLDDSRSKMLLIEN